ncbi:MAG: hypothetical protein ACLR0P_08075 [Oscillospiraceae bacterium]
MTALNSKPDPCPPAGLSPRREACAEVSTISRWKCRSGRQGAEGSAVYHRPEDRRDTDWDSYVTNLKNLGLDRLVELYNTAYQRQYVK